MDPGEAGEEVMEDQPSIRDAHPLSLSLEARRLATVMVSLAVSIIMIDSMERAPIGKLDQTHCRVGPSPVQRTCFGPCPQHFKKILLKFVSFVKLLLCTFFNITITAKESYPPNLYCILKSKSLLLVSKIKYILFIKSPRKVHQDYRSVFERGQVSKIQSTLVIQSFSGLSMHRICQLRFALPGKANVSRSVGY